MIKIVNAGDSSFERALAALRNRLGLMEQTASDAAQQKTIAVFGRPLTPIEVVRKIVADVRQKGDDALLDYTQKLDGCALEPATLKVTDEEIDAAYEKVPAELIEAIRAAISNVEAYQQHIKLQSLVEFDAEGVSIQTRYEPLKTVGVCVPGMLAAYPSTPIMAIVPARVAGVERVVVVTPPGSDGSVAPATLVAAKESGADEIYRVGGAQAVAALAFGTATIPRVDKIVGPGNLFVMLAKKEIFGHADIDMFAGPSEILVIADSTAKEDYIAADMLSQAEHDPLASAILVTPSEQLAEAVVRQINLQLPNLSTHAVAAESIEHYGLIVVAESLDDCARLCNEIAPEHVEIMTVDPAELAAKIRNAGAIFLGPHTPEVVGDYYAGSSHILPTGGTARFFSGLSVNSFLRKTAVIEYSASALREALPHLQAIGSAEGFAAHAASAEIRFPRPDEPNAKGKKAT